MLIAIGLFMMAAGVFHLCAAWYAWDWYMNLPKARRMIALVGERGARIVYAVLGGVLVIGGLVALVVGVIGVSG